MMRRRHERGGRVRKKRMLLNNLVMAAVRELFTDTVERSMWMFRVRDCRHICLFCEHYEKCGIDGLPKRGGEGKMSMQYAKRSKDTEQIEVMSWAHWHTGKYPELKWLHHIPNGGSRNRLEAKKLKDMGVKPGVADLFLPCPRGCYHGMYIEMKFGSNRHTDRQKEFLADMAAAGYFAATCYSADEAIRVIEEYIQLPKEIVYYEDKKLGGIRSVYPKEKMSIPNNSILKDGKIKEILTK